MFHSSAKHIELDLHIIYEKILHMEIVISYVPTTDKIVDIFERFLKELCENYHTKRKIHIESSRIKIQDLRKRT